MTRRQGMARWTPWLMAAAVLGQRTAQGWLDFYTTDRVADGKNPLNPGMVRMNLGNRIRAHHKQMAEEAGESQAA